MKNDFYFTAKTNSSLKYCQGTPLNRRIFGFKENDEKDEEENIDNRLLPESEKNDYED